ncbi:unnamed protein product [Sphacelaria rigidula]
MEPFAFEAGPMSTNRATASFAQHEKGYHRCSQNINRHINGLQLGKVEAVAALDLPDDLEEAEQYVKGMEIEVRSMKGNDRRQCQSRANQCRADLRSLRRSLEQAAHRVQADELMRREREGVNGEWAGVVGPDLAQQSLARSRLSLLDSQRVLEETEGIGQGVVGDLESQRESLLRSQAHVRDTGRVSDKARRLLRSIARKEFRHRLMLYLIILGLSTAIVFVLYFKIRRRFK